MNRSLITTIFSVLFFELLTAETIPTGSRPFHIESQNAEKTAERFIELMKKEDYFGVYDLVSHGVVNHYKEAIIQFRPDNIGINFDFDGVVLSDFGLRYGMLAYFDQGLASIRESGKGWGRQFIEGNFEKVSSDLEKYDATVVFRSREGSMVSVLLIKNQNSWRLEQVKFDDFTWPMGLVDRSQPGYTTRD